MVIGNCSPTAAGLSRVISQPAGAAAQPATTPVVESRVDRRVFIEGDSLTVGMSSSLGTLLEEAGWTATLDAQIGRATPEGISSLAGRAYEIGGTLVVALGTNDPPDPEAFSANVDQVMNIAAGRRVIWVTIARAGREALDDALISAQYRWANLHVIDWRRVIAAHPGVLAGDGIHLTQAGYDLRAEFVASAIENAA